MKKQSRILHFVNTHLNKCLVVLIAVSFINVVSGWIFVSHNASVLCSVSVLLSFLFSIYAISNISGAKLGHHLNMHIIRWFWLKKHDREHEYETTCLKYLCVMFPASVVWSIANLVLAIIK